MSYHSKPGCIAAFRREVVLLKELWDMIAVVDSSIAAWRTTPWRDIQVEDMELECKRYAKEIRALDKEVLIQIRCLPPTNIVLLSS